MRLLQNIGVYLAIIFLVVLQYADTFQFDYAWDDAIVILENDRVQKGFEGIPEVFRNIKSDEIQHRYGYRPITLMSFAIDVGLWGMDPKPAHVVNVLLYALGCVLLFRFLRLIFSNRSGWMAFFITILFVVHPVHSEVVANIKSRDEILALIFGILSLIFFTKFCFKNRYQWIYAILAITALILAFLSRENGLIFGGIMLLIAWYKEVLSFKNWKTIFLPFLGLSLLFIIRKFVYSDLFFENRSIELIEQGKYLEDGFIGNPLTDVTSFFERLANSFYILLKDFQLLVFPKTLVHDYAYAHSTIVSWTNPWVIISLLFHSFLIFVVVKNWRKRNLINFGIGFYFISIFLYLHILQVGPDYLAERYLFVPSIGFLITIFGVLEWLSKASFSSAEKPILSTSVGKGATVMLCVGFILFFVKTKERVQAWENNLTLFETDIELAPQNARLQHNYAVLLHQMYKQRPSIKKQEKIIEHYKNALEISPRSVRAMIDLGKAYMEFGQGEKALPVFLQCTEIYPEISVAYIQIGKYYLAKKEYHSALKYFDIAKQKGISNPDIYYLRGVTLMMMKQNDRAKQELIDGLKYHPSFGNYFSLLSDYYFLDKEMELSKKYLEKAIELSPGDTTLKTKLNERFSDTLSSHTTESN